MLWMGWGSLHPAGWVRLEKQSVTDISVKNEKGEERDGEKMD